MKPTLSFLIFEEGLALKSHTDNTRRKENKQKLTMKKKKSKTFSEGLSLKTKIQDYEQLSTKVDVGDSRLH